MTPICYGATLAYCAPCQDREWHIKAHELSSNYVVKTCTWSNWVNEYKGDLRFQCPNGGVVRCALPCVRVLHGIAAAGCVRLLACRDDAPNSRACLGRNVHSIHLNDDEDRKWKFECCELEWNTNHVKCPDTGSSHLSLPADASLATSSTGEGALGDTVNLLCAPGFKAVSTSGTVRCNTDNVSWVGAVAHALPAYRGGACVRSCVSHADRCPCADVGRAIAGGL